MKWLGFILAFLVAIPVYGESDNLYKVHINLQDVHRDRIKITIFPPAISRNEVQYQLPVVVPGTYEYTRYNQYVRKFRAYEKNGDRLRVRSLEGRSFLIRNATKLHKIEYWIDDTWDLRLSNASIFHPGGTNFQEEENFLLNHFGLFGYIRGYKYFPFQLTIQKPNMFYGSSSLQMVSSNNTEDVWYSSSYHDLIDNPIMYNRPDTLSFSKDSTQINISVYSKNNVVTAHRIEPIIRKVTDAVDSFFEGLPLSHYSFIFYFSGYQQKDINRSRTYGALEHKNSSVYFLPEIYSETMLEDIVQGIAIHELLHILTPLNFKSNKLVYFNLLNPEMSSHLWLYEGVTEYFANWLMLSEGLITEDEFITEMRYKILRSNFYEPVSFTEMSRYILEEPYNEMYENVYEKGAILGLLLDIKINELTDSRLNLRQVVLDMAEDYGSEPFNDDSFIDEFVARVHPDLKTFFDRYVIGTDSLPVNKYFQKLGWEYRPETSDTIYSFGNIRYHFDPQNETFNIGRTHPRQNVFGLKGGEEIIAIDENKVTPENYTSLFRKIIEPVDREKVTLKVKSDDKVMSMLAEPIPVKAVQYHKIDPFEEKNHYQENLRNKLFQLQ